jgi:hypothetical protein
VGRPIHFTYYLCGEEWPESVGTTVLRFSRALKVVLLKTTMRYIVFCVLDVHDAVIMVRIIIIRTVRNLTYFVLLVK